MTVRILLFTCSLFCVIPVFAQMERTVYQHFEVDSAQSIALDIVGFTYPQLHVWAGNTILTEANIQVWDATPEVVQELIKTGRYAFEAEKTGDSLRIFTKVRKREDIKMFGMRTKCVEQTTVKIFIPDIYEWDPAEWAPDQTGQPKHLRRKQQ